MDKKRKIENNKIDGAKNNNPILKSFVLLHKFFFFATFAWAGNLPTSIIISPPLSTLLQLPLLIVHSYFDERSITYLVRIIILLCHLCSGLAVQ